MAIGTVIRRTLQITIGLIVIGVLAIGALGSYVEYRIESSPELRDRLELSLQAAEYRVDKDAGFFDKLGVLISVWWNSDELLAEAERDKALERRAEARSREEQTFHRFNDQSVTYDDDYYPAPDK